MPGMKRQRVRAALSLLLWAGGLSAAHAADPVGSGPEPAIVYSDAALPTHTVYRPAQLASRYPVVLWGNGSCVDSNFGYREFLAEVGRSPVSIIFDPDRGEIV